MQEVQGLGDHGVREVQRLRVMGGDPRFQVRAVTVVFGSLVP